MMRRRAMSLLTVICLMGAALVGLAQPASAAACYYPGGGQFGADETGTLPSEGNGLAYVQPVIYALIGYTDLSPGCASGVLDLVAYSVTGLPATCTLVLPALPGSGTGCSNVGGIAGVANVVYPVTQAYVTVYAQLTAVGADGTRITRTSSPCTGSLFPYVADSFRCSL